MKDAAVMVVDALPLLPQEAQAERVRYAHHALTQANSLKATSESVGNLLTL